MGEQYLKWRSTPQWGITIETGGDHQILTPGQWLQINHPYFLNGSITELCINAELDINTGSIALQFGTPTDAIQPVTLTSMSAAFDPQTMKGTQIQFANGQATLSFVNDKGLALSGAKVTFDGSQVKITDKAGKATFKTARGMHHVKVEAAGYQTMEGEIEI
jgi:hypothetical protein